MQPEANQDNKIKTVEKPAAKPTKKKKPWIRFRHRIVRNIAFAILYPYSRIKYGIKIEKFRETKKREYLILMNHQTAFDQFFLGSAFKNVIYYLASEDIFSNGFISKLLRYLVAPIPIKKQTTDVHAIINCIRVAKEGGSIALAPEGNRTYSGKTEFMSPAIAPLARKLGLPIALYRIEGGYGVHPRWSDVVRKGKMRGYVSRVIEPEEYASMTNDELFDEIRNGLYVNEAEVSGTFRHKKTAEYLERAVYVCPFCGLSTFESHNDLITCKTCQKQIRYLPTKELEGVGFDFPFPFVAQWYDYQTNFINALDPMGYVDAPMYHDLATVSKVIPCKKKEKLKKDAPIYLYGDRIVIGAEGADDEFSRMHFDDIAAVVVLGKNKLNIYYNKTIYQLKGDKRFNALKYVQIYHRYKNIKTGDGNGSFLGL